MCERIERCDKCKWWVPFTEEEGYGSEFFNVREHGDATGLCHRSPPVQRAAQSTATGIRLSRDARSSGDDADELYYPDFNFDWHWPATVSSDFCGEFAPAVPQKKADA